jgi:hypothetical protein
MSDALKELEELYDAMISVCPTATIFEQSYVRLDIVRKFAAALARVRQQLEAETEHP